MVPKNELFFSQKMSQVAIKERRYIFLLQKMCVDARRREEQSEKNRGAEEGRKFLHFRPSLSPNLLSLYILNRTIHRYRRRHHHQNQAQWQYGEQEFQRRRKERLQPCC